MNDFILLIGKWYSTRYEIISSITPHVRLVISVYLCCGLLTLSDKLCFV